MRELATFGPSIRSPRQWFRCLKPFRHIRNTYRSQECWTRFGACQGAAFQGEYQKGHDKWNDRCQPLKAELFSMARKASHFPYARNTRFFPFVQYAVKNQRVFGVGCVGRGFRYRRWPARSLRSRGWRRAESREESAFKSGDLDHLKLLGSLLSTSK